MLHIVTKLTKGNEDEVKLQIEPKVKCKVHRIG